MSQTLPPTYKIFGFERKLSGSWGNEIHAYLYLTKCCAVVRHDLFVFVTVKFLWLAQQAVLYKEAEEG